MRFETCARFSVVVLFAALLLTIAAAADDRTRRDVYVSGDAAPGGDGSRERPYGSIHEVLEKHQEDWGQVFLGPGIYQEDVVVERDGLWFFPWKQYDVVIQGSFTIKGKGVALRGFTFHSQQKAIVVEATADGCQVQNNRVVDLSDGGVGIHVEGGALVIGNVVDLRNSNAQDTIGLRLRAGGGKLPLVGHNRVAGAGQGILIDHAGEPTDTVWRLTHNEIRQCAAGMRVLADRVTAKYNRIWRCTGPGLDVQGDECTVEHNAVFDNTGDARPTRPDADNVLSETPAQPRTIHVLASAAPGGDGSVQKPFASLAPATADLQPGDTVVVGDGMYHESVTISALGAADAPVIIRSQHKHGAVISEGRITLDDCMHARIEGLSFVASPAAVLFQADARHCTVSGCRFVTTNGKPNSTIRISGPSASHNVIQDCILDGQGRRQVGIQVLCQRFNRHCIMRRCVISGYSYAVQTGGGSYPTAPPGYHLIEDCDFFENMDGVHHKMTDCTVRNCRLHHNSNYGITVRYGARQLIENNRIHHNGTGIRLHSPSHLVRNNVIYANRNGGILASVFMGEPFYEPPTSIFIVNNTFWRNGRQAIRLEQGARLAWLRNILVGDSPDQWLIVRKVTDEKAAWDQSGAVRMADFNLYGIGRAPLLNEYEGGEHDLYADPQFVDPNNGDFTLAPDSPAREAVPKNWAALPPVPFAVGVDDAWRTLGASEDVSKPRTSRQNKSFGRPFDSCP